MSLPSHVSEALASLRGWVTLAASVLALALVAHVLAFGFTVATDIRSEQLRPAVSSAPLEIVRSGTPAKARPAETYARGVDINAARSAADVRLRALVTLSARVGSVAAIALAAMTLLGVAIAGGGNVPGVHRAAQAAFFATALAVCVLPWSRAFGPGALPGLLADDDTITGACALHNAGNFGTVALLAQFVAAPLLAVGVCLLIVLWFRDGVDRGIIMRSVSQFDRAIDAELRDIERRGVASATPRTLGALNRALGDPGDHPPPASPVPGRPI
jgi:hypothetical protein